jgi:hypothetical protein
MLKGRRMNDEKHGSRATPPMTCREFRRACNELMDAGLTILGERPEGGDPTDEWGAAATDVGRRMRVHAAACPACREVAARYVALRRALRAWGPPPAAPSDLADRIMSEIQPQSQPIFRRAATEGNRRLWRVGLPLATIAASVAAAVTIGLSTPKKPIDQPRANHPRPTTSLLPSGGRPLRAELVSTEAAALNQALAGATEATLDLARSASEPAARLSRQVLDAATAPELNQSVAATGVETVSVPWLGSLAPDSDVAVAMLQQVGDRLASGVGPLSTTARHAFGFLLGPAAPRPQVRPNPPTARGA